MLRSILALLSGAILAALLIALVEYLGHTIFPPPPGMDPMDMESVKAAMKDAPAGALIFVLLAWAVGTFAGGSLAVRIAQRAPLVHAGIIGALFLIGGVANMLVLPHPAWFWIPGILVFPAASCLAAKLASTDPAPSLPE